MGKSKKSCKKKKCNTNCSTGWLTNTKCSSSSSCSPCSSSSSSCSPCSSSSSSSCCSKKKCKNNYNFFEICSNRSKRNFLRSITLPDIVDNTGYTTFNSTFNGVSNLRNQNGDNFVTFKVINRANEASIQWEPFSFILRNSNGYIELNHKINHTPKYSMTYPIRLFTNNQSNISYAEVVENKLRIYLNNNGQCCNIGSNFSINGHNLSWIK